MDKIQNHKLTKQTGLLLFSIPLVMHAVAFILGTVNNENFNDELRNKRKNVISCMPYRPAGAGNEYIAGKIARKTERREGFLYRLFALPANKIPGMPAIHPTVDHKTAHGPMRHPMPQGPNDRNNCSHQSVAGLSCCFPGTRRKFLLNNKYQP